MHEYYMLREGDMCWAYILQVRGHQHVGVTVVYCKGVTVACGGDGGGGVCVTHCVCTRRSYLGVGSTSRHMAAACHTRHPFAARRAYTLRCMCCTGGAGVRCEGAPCSGVLITTLMLPLGNRHRHGDMGLGRQGSVSVGRPRLCRQV